ncbi:ABC transporter permease [Tepiditoga spiralis]|nr:FtsX-like permease family protein [Tepiditoga spiralis]
MINYLIIIATILIFIFFILNRKNIIMKMAFRNIFRKKTEAFLMVLGSMIGMAFIIGALGINDSFNNYVYENIEKYFGEVDEVLFSGTGIKEKSIKPFLEELKEKKLIDGVIPIYQTTYPISKKGNLKSLKLSEIKQVGFVGMDYSKLKNFGSTKINIPDEFLDLKDNEAIITKDLSKTLNIKVGDSIEVIQGKDTLSFLFPKTYKVKKIVDLKGILNYRGRHAEGVNGSVFLTLNSARQGKKFPTGTYTDFLISNTGGIIEGNSHTKEIKKIYNKYKNLPSITYSKDNQIQKLSGGEIAAIFIFFSGFAIISGGILIINMYSMMVDERKRELGILRAIGVQKTGIRNIIFYESILYTLFSVPIGIFTGIFLSKFTFSNIAEVSSSIASSNIVQSIPTFNSYHITLNSIYIGVLLGIIIPISITYFYTLIISKLNVVEAIKNIKNIREKNSLFNYILFFILSIAFLFININYVRYTSISFLILLFPYILKKKNNLLKSITPLITLLLPFLFKSDEILMLSSKSILILISIILLTINNFIIFEKIFLSIKIKKMIPILKIALTYPMREKKKTGLIVSLYGIVIFVIVVVTILPYLQTQKLALEKDSLFAGFDGVVVEMPGGFIPIKLNSKELNSLDSIKTAGEFYMLTAGKNNIEIPLIFGSNEFFSFNKLKIKDKIPELSNKTDREIWNFIYNNTGFAIVPQNYIDGMNDIKLELGKTYSFNLNKITFIPGSKPESQSTGKGAVSFKIAAIISNVSDTLAIGPLLSVKNLNIQNFKNDGIHGYYFALSNNKNAKKDLTKYLKQKNQFFIFVDDIIDIGLKVTSGIVKIINSFLYFGLIVGILSISITTIKSVEERKRIIGMMKAIGYTNNMIFGVFFIESTFVILTGIIIGIVSGIITSYQIYKVFFSNLSFKLPMKSLLLMGLIFYIISIIFTFFPARKASKISPAESMKVMD